MHTDTIQNLRRLDSILSKNRGFIEGAVRAAFATQEQEGAVAVIQQEIGRTTRTATGNVGRRDLAEKPAQTAWRELVREYRRNLKTVLRELRNRHQGRLPKLDPIESKGMGVSALDTAYRVLGPHYLDGSLLPEHPANNGFGAPDRMELAISQLLTFSHEIRSVIAGCLLIIEWQQGVSGTFQDYARLAFEAGVESYPSDIFLHDRDTIRTANERVVFVVKGNGCGTTAIRRKDLGKLVLDNPAAAFQVDPETGTVRAVPVCKVVAHAA